MELLQIEIAALQTAGINLQAIRTATAALAAAEDTKFDKSLDLGNVAAIAQQTFKSKAFKQQMRQDGVDTMSTFEKFCQAVFGKKATWIYKTIKAHTNMCDFPELYAQYRQLAANGEIALDVAVWNKYCATDGEIPAEDGDGEDGEDKTITLMTFAMKSDMFADGKGVSARVTADGELHISGDESKIPYAILSSMRSFAAFFQQTNADGDDYYSEENPF